MKCKFCNKEIDEGSIFCGYCGKEQPKVKKCIKCGQEIDIDDAFCGYCGASQINEKDVIISEEQGALDEAIQIPNNKPIEENSDIVPQSLEPETIDEADERQESQEDSVSLITPTKQVEKDIKEEKTVEETKDEGGGAESSPSSLDYIEDDNSNNIKKYVITALITVLIFLGGYGAYLYFYNNSDSEVSNTENIDNKTIALKGTINNKIGFTMQLSISGNSIEGTEHYDSQRTDANIVIRGTKKDNGTVTLSEYDGNTKAGTFEGTIEAGVLSGNFTNAKGTSFPFYAEISSLGEERTSSIEANESSTAFTTKHVTFKRSDKDAETTIEIDYPVGGDKKLVETVRKRILETLVNIYTWGDPMPEYTGDVADGQAIADFYGNAKMKKLKKESRDKNMSTQIYEEISINMIKETMKFVTYEVSFGGCHGGVNDYSTKGVTFLKKSGKEIELIKNPNDKNFQKLLIKYVKEWVGDEVDALSDSFFENPMPSTPPVLSFNGVTFNYHKGEIIYMLAGNPSVTIPFDEIMPFLTDDAKEVIGNN